MDSLTPKRLVELQTHANDVRQGIVRSLLAAGSGHSAGSLDMADVFTALYFHVLRHDPANPEWPERDRLLLSCGHIAPVRYSAMAYAGYFPVEELLTLRRFGTRLQGHPERVSLPGLETTSGPLGEGLAQGTGMALAAKMDGKDGRVYVVTSDAEHQCGLHFEAMMTAPKFKLDNLTCIVDRNFIQIDGSTEDVMPLEPLADKYRAFNWDVHECDGNDISAFIETEARARRIAGKPHVIIAHTVPGKGVSFMEGDYLWHGKPPKADEAAAALRELTAGREALTAHV
ncbi:transketolase [Vulcanimicrobium alpinum]|uniref:Transketolase n=1 Tax=Vulcanimicrobium alpinum TaxID=3016050 RepID=A0AAN1XXF2_UNVUL|nr:transketolase [Vulcanimicrobium alpinum]BDE07175.1 transketolase [Vulcanimicrobium alpinum]